MKFKALTHELPGVEEDYVKAGRYDRWRVGTQAFYLPGGFNTIAYLPLNEITSAYPHDFRVKGGCSCAGTIVTGGVVLKYGDNEIIKVVPGSEKYAPKLLNALKEQIPDLDRHRSGAYLQRRRKRKDNSRDGTVRPGSRRRIQGADLPVHEGQFLLGAKRHGINRRDHICPGKG